VNHTHFPKKDRLPIWARRDFKVTMGDRVDRIDTIDSPDDEHLVARNMYRIGINKYKEKNCASSWTFTNTVE